MYILVVVLVVVLHVMSYHSVFLHMWNTDGMCLGWKTYHPFSPAVAAPTDTAGALTVSSFVLLLPPVCFSSHRNVRSSLVLCIYF